MFKMRRAENFEDRKPMARAGALNTFGAPGRLLADFRYTMAKINITRPV